MNAPLTTTYLADVSIELGLLSLELVEDGQDERGNPYGEAYVLSDGIPVAETHTEHGETTLRPVMQLNDFQRWEILAWAREYMGEGVRWAR